LTALFLLTAFALSGCGNPDYGKMGKVKTSGDAVEAATSVTSGQSFGPCQGLVVFPGSNPTTAQAFTGAQACAGISDPTAVLLKTGASFPANTRACLVPTSSSAIYLATCFTISGQATLRLSTASFSSVSLVLESDLSAYLTYLYGQSSYPPAYGIAALH
jgi:hypothetical protein